MEVWVRTALISSASSTTFTQAPGTTTGGGLLVFQITSTAGLKAGISGIRQSAIQNNQSASTTPAPVLGSTPISQDGIITAVFNATNPAGVPRRSGYSLQANLGYATPTTGIAAAVKNNTETSATIAWAGTSATAFCSLAVEIDTRATHTNTGGLTGAGSAVSNMVVDALVIGGGGGGSGLTNTTGSQFAGGGGGAGEVRLLSNFAVFQGNSLTVTVGTGGAGGSTSYPGISGTSSVFSSITASGGTGAPDRFGGASGNGYAGGTETGVTDATGGGGGSTGAGTLGVGGTGGSGTNSSITGSSANYAGGGGGAALDGTGGSGSAGGGTGGSASSSGSNSQAGGNATANTGSGGGGGAGFDAATGGNGGSGGSGIVVLSYLNTYPLASSTTGSPTVTNTGGRYIYVWTGNGSITWPVFGAIHPHTTTGALIGQGSTIAGAAKRFVTHATTGALVGLGSTVTGTANRSPLVIPHATTGALTGQGSVVTGAATRQRLHGSTGALTGPGAVVAGSARRFVTHPSTGALTGAGSVVTGAAFRSSGPVAHTTTGALVAAGSVVTGEAFLVLTKKPRQRTMTGVGL